MEFIKCGMCGVEIPKGGHCVLAAEERKIEGKEYIFCCVRCAEKFEKNK